MHLLSRPDPPAFLANYSHGTHQWDRVTPSRYERLRLKVLLRRMQGERCAYCECNLNQNGQHIEHFEQRSRYPALTFVWDNLFWSCERECSCGKHKDKQSYNPNDLIKPDLDDPEHFFVFITDGTIAIRQGLSPRDQQRATETLRIFNLDDQRGPLRAMRKAAISGYLHTAQAIQEIANEYPPADWLPFLEQELDVTRDLPFCTAIKHALSPAP